MKTGALALTLAASLATAACGSSPPTRYYVLDAVAPTGGAPPPPKAGPVRLAAVHLPDELDRLEIVSALGPNRLQLRGQDRWAAPLDEMSRRVLAQDLAQRLPPGAMIPPRSPAPRDVREIVVDVQRFDAESDGSARLQGMWSVKSPDGALARRLFDLRAPMSGANAEAQAAAMSGLLAALADQIAAAPLP